MLSPMADRGPRWWLGDPTKPNDRLRRSVVRSEADAGPVAQPVVDRMSRGPRAVGPLPRAVRNVW
jgi:hypothetical protein